MKLDSVANLNPGRLTMQGRKVKKSTGIKGQICIWRPWIDTTCVLKKKNAPCIYV